MTHARFRIRSTELMLVSATLLLMLMMLVLAQIGLTYQEGKPFHFHEIESLESLMLFGIALFAASLALGWLAPDADPLFLPLIAFLGGLSLLFLYRLPLYSTLDGEWHTGNVLTARSQALKFVIGFVVMLIIVAWQRLPHYWYEYRGFALLIGIGLLLFTAVFGVAPTVGGPRISLDLRVLSFQPTELVKVLFVGYMAGYLARRAVSLTRPHYVMGLAIPRLNLWVPILVMFLLCALFLYVMGDLGAVLVLALLFPVLSYAGSSERLFWGLTSIVVLILVAAFLVTDISWNPCSVLPATACQRVQVWQDPFGIAAKMELEPGDFNPADQLMSGFYAMGAGGPFGQGLGLGLPAEVTVSVLQSDMIYVGIVEDLGLAGALALLGAYMLLLWQGLRIARQQGERFPKLLAVGIVTLFGAQVTVLLGGVLGVMPLTGITLPFVSEGGTSILINMALVGILLRLSNGKMLAGQLPETDRRILQARYFYAGTLFALWAATGYWSVFRAAELNPGFDSYVIDPLNNPARQRRQAWARRIERGRILASNNEELVANGPTGRSYSEVGLTLVHTLGLVEGDTNFGLSGLEYTFNRTLMGERKVSLRRILQQWSGQRWEGDSLRLTIEPVWQRASARALGEQAGAVVVLDAHSGAVIAMVSAPGYDPNRLELAQDSIRKAQLNRATNELYAPGSTFKAVVGALAVEHGLASPERVFRYPQDQWVWNGTSWCHFMVLGTDSPLPSCNTPAVLETMSLGQAYTYSDNVVFAELARELGPDRFRTGTSDFGFEQLIPFDIDVVPSVVESSSSDGVGSLSDEAMLAISGIGQGNVKVTPLHMALVAAAIANEGKVPRPYLVQEVISPGQQSGTQVAVTDTWKEPISAQTAATLHRLMLDAVAAPDGHSGAARTGNQQVDSTLGGKTGTAEAAGNGDAHAWYIGFATLPDGRTTAFAVVVENKGQGSEVAAPIVRAILADVLGYTSPTEGQPSQ